jgi:4-hydroxythreonine-4-phosphate dehydrogenase
MPAVRVGVTMGDPSGIGPEILSRALATPLPTAELEVFGDAGVLERAGGLSGAVRVHAVTQLAPEDAAPGRPTARSGRAQVEYLEQAIARVRSGDLDALVTAPIHKASAHAAGFALPGHTEFLARELGAARPIMMLAGPRLRVALVTVHIPLAEVPGRLTAKTIEETLRGTALALQVDFAIGRPRVAVCGLNPHAGEQGAFGSEEATIARAIAAAKTQPGAAELSGPHVPDAIFRRASQGEFDAVVAMYHDQGLIPVKLVDFDETVNVTLGLPIVRTSPDHGTAHDIAGRGVARPRPMRRALELAIEIAQRRRAPRSV